MPHHRPGLVVVQRKEGVFSVLNSNIAGMGAIGEKMPEAFIKAVGDIAWGRDTTPPVGNITFIGPAVDALPQRDIVRAPSTL